jgi:hypothetical protein
MLRSARVLAVAALISATLCGISNAAPIAPLVVQTQLSDFTQVHYYHRHSWPGSYPYRYYPGWHPCLNYWWTWACGGGWWYPSPVLR